jgi:hypothetical protein
MRYLLAIGLLLATITPVAAQHDLSARQQWQPWITEGGLDPDRRLEQPVEIEIIGQAAIPVLKLLSEKTGVTLGVAPEDPETVGERKLLLLAKGCRLKELMALIPIALQECHWDIDRSGPEPSYWLHRNSDAEASADRLRQEEDARTRERERIKRAARVEEVRRALRMSPQELDELEKSDLFLARALREPETRAAMEAFFSLPAERMQEFLNAGSLAMPSQQVMRSKFQTELARAESAEGLAALLPAMTEEERSEVYPGLNEQQIKEQVVAEARGRLETLPDATVWLRGFGSDYILSINGSVMLVVPARYPISPLFSRRLLLRTGTGSRDEADRLIQEWRAKGQEARRKDREALREQAWKEPPSPELQRRASLASNEQVEVAEFLRMVGQESGLSLVADYFTGDAAYLDPQEEISDQPLWRLLYLVGEAGGFRWELRGGCLTCYHRDWYYLAQREVPESLIAWCRARLRGQGRLTLDDVVKLAAALQERGLARRWLAFPPDLAELQSALNPRTLWAWLLYASLSADQVAKARSQEGLSYPDMSGAARRQVSELASRWGSAQAQVERAKLRISESTGKEEGKQFTQYDFRLELPDLPEADIHAWVRLSERPTPQ